MPPAPRRQARAAAALALLAALAACAGPGTYQTSGLRTRPGHYRAPGPPEDPWGPYIREASLRFGVPEAWVRAVMRQESAGRDDAVSSAGAMGLMQVMPQTYAMLRARYGLGDDPYEPHDNIMAGSGYIRELYDRYGAPGFLAAYNAGPNRVDSYMADGTPLPEETVGYLSSIAPRLGAGTAMSGPLAVFAGNTAGAAAPYEPPPAATAPVLTARAPAETCDPDAAYDPDRPCAPPPVLAAAPIPAPAPYAPAPYSAIRTPASGVYPGAGRATRQSQHPLVRWRMVDPGRRLPKSGSRPRFGRQRSPRRARPAGRRRDHDSAHHAVWWRGALPRPPHRALA